MLLRFPRPCRAAAVGVYPRGTTAEYSNERAAEPTTWRGVSSPAVTPQATTAGAVPQHRHDVAAATVTTADGVVNQAAQASQGRWQGDHQATSWLRQYAVVCDGWLPFCANPSIHCSCQASHGHPAVVATRHGQSQRRVTPTVTATGSAPCRSPTTSPLRCPVRLLMREFWRPSWMARHHQCVTMVPSHRRQHLGYVAFRAELLPVWLLVHS